MGKNFTGEVAIARQALATLVRDMRDTLQIGYLELSVRVKLSEAALRAYSSVSQGFPGRESWNRLVDFVNSSALPRKGEWKRLASLVDPYIRDSKMGVRPPDERVFRLAKIMGELKMSPKVIAIRTGLPANAIKDAMRGKALSRAEMVKMISFLSGINPDWGEVLGEVPVAAKEHEPDPKIEIGAAPRPDQGLVRASMGLLLRLSEVWPREEVPPRVFETMRTMYAYVEETKRAEPSAQGKEMYERTMAPYVVWLTRKSREEELSARVADLEAKLARMQGLMKQQMELLG